MSNPFRYFNSSPEVIRLVVMMYVRYPLSLRNVEDLLAERGIDISFETVRFWWNRFGPMFAAKIRKKRVERMRGYPQWRWHLDEVFVKVNGKLCYLWRAVDHEGEVLEAVVTAKRDKAAALKLLKRIMKKYGRPRKIVTDGLALTLQDASRRKARPIGGGLETPTIQDRFLHCRGPNGPAVGCSLRRGPAFFCEDDAGYKDYAAFVAKYLSPGELVDLYAVAAYSEAATMVQVLKQCGDDLSHENIMREAAKLKDLELPMLLPAMKVNTSPDNFYPIWQMQLAAFNGESWEPFGDLISG